MSHPDLPTAVKAMLADEAIRVHHHLWHFVRDRAAWEGLPDADRRQLQAQGWAPPRFQEEPGAGLDFLSMHREMIAMVDMALAHANDPAWPGVSGWDPIPWSETDANWPVPAWQATPPSWASEEQWTRYTDIAMRARSSEQVAEMRELASVLDTPARLRDLSLDELGSTLEWSIHGWMHIRWSGAPSEAGFSADPSNDWLFVPWSSHVNRHFWKLHGWIDDRVGHWESATGMTADLSIAWSGPPGTLPGMPHSADTRLLEHVPPREMLPMPMQVKQHVVEGVLGR